MALRSCECSGGPADLVVTGLDAGSLPYFDYERSLAEPAAAANAVTVAALDAQDGTYPHEAYSSEGPVYGPGGSLATSGATTMDLSSYANVDTETFGPPTASSGLRRLPHT